MNAGGSRPDGRSATRTHTAKRERSVSSRTTPSGCTHEQDLVKINI
jgi:hypothetical protein